MTPCESCPRRFALDQVIGDDAGLVSADPDAAKRSSKTHSEADRYAVDAALLGATLRGLTRSAGLDSA